MTREARRSPMPTLRPLPYPVPNFVDEATLFSRGRWRLVKAGYNTYDVLQKYRGRWVHVAAGVQDLDSAFKIFETNVDGDRPITGVIYPHY